MSDDFEKAVLFTFDHTGAVDPGLKERAHAYCESIKWSPGAWRGLLDRFQASQYPEVKFWCLQAIDEVFRKQYTQLDPNERMLVKQALMQWMRDDCTRPNHFPPFLKNKLAQVIICVIQFEFPKEWPSFFSDLMAMLPGPPLAVDMFCRVMKALDEEVISLEFHRPDEGGGGRLGSMDMKDAMREGSTALVMEAFYSLASALHASDPPLAATVLQTMARYVGWVDISLVVNPKLALLFTLLQPAADEDVRAAACEVLREVVTKRMEAAKKILLVQQLDLSNVLTASFASLAGGARQPVTELLATLATEVFDCWKELVGAGAGGGVAGTAGAEVAAAAEAAAGVLAGIFPALVAALGGDDDDGCRAVLPYLNNWVGRIAKPPAPASPDMMIQCIRGLLDVLGRRMRCTGGVDWEGGGGSDNEDALAARDELATLFKNIIRVAPAEGTAYVQGQLATALGGGAGATWRDVEGAIHLLYNMGEVTPHDQFSPDSPLGQLVAMLVGSTGSIPGAGHRMVALAYMETVVRYGKIVQQIPQFLPRVLMAYLDERGLRHPHPGVQSRAAYMVMRLAKSVRQQVVPMMAEILASLTPALEAVARATPKECVAEGGERYGHGGGTDEQLYVFEAVGLLLGQEELPKEDQLRYMEGVIALLCREIEGGLSQIPPEDKVGSPAAVAMIKQSIVAMGYFSKGFSPRLAMTVRPEVGRLLGGGLEVVLGVLNRLPANGGVRGRIFSFLHRMAEGLRLGVVPYLPAAIEGLMSHGGAVDLCNIVVLLNQIMPKAKNDLVPLLDKVLPALLEKLFSLLPGGSDAIASKATTEEVRERQEVQKSMYGLLHGMGGAGLLPVLLGPACRDFLPRVMAALMQGAGTHEDVLVRKVCVQTFRILIQEWCGGAGADEMVPGFRRYVVEHFGPECCVRSCLRGDLDFRDANAAAVLGELAVVSKLIYERCGDDYLAHLCQVVLPGVQCPPALQQQYVMHLQQDDAKQLKAFMRELAETMRPPGGGGMGNGHVAAVVH